MLRLRYRVGLFTVPTTLRKSYFQTKVKKGGALLGQRDDWMVWVVSCLTVFSSIWPCFLVFPLIWLGVGPSSQGSFFFLLLCCLFAKELGRFKGGGGESLLCFFNGVLLSENGRTRHRTHRRSCSHVERTSNDQDWSIDTVNMTVAY